MTTDEPIFTTDDVALMLKTSAKTVLRTRARKKIRVKLLGTEYRWTKAQADQLLDDEPAPRKPKKPKAAKNAQADEATAPTSTPSEG